MRKLISLSLIPFACVVLVACNDAPETVASGAVSETSITEGNFTEYVARTVHGQINNVLYNPSSTEQDLLKYATPNFITQLGKEYGGYSFKEVHTAFIERAEYWEHDEAVDESIANAVDTGSTATSIRTLSTNNYNYAKSPETSTCTIQDSWVKDSEGWKLDYVDDTDCDKN